jgi:hypothetical protein
LTATTSTPEGLQPQQGWPFWAPSDTDAVEHALDVARLRSGEHLVDLGCGDGKVLVAAARRGASVEGVEVDEELAQLAREALVANGFDGAVDVGDVFEHSLTADVLFTYLSPATLQRLTDRLQRSTRPGTRLVTLDYAVPGLRPTVVDGRIHLYELPAGVSRARKPGWGTAGVLTTVVPDSQSLTAMSFVHPGGAVVVELDGGNLARALTLAVGADHATRGQEVAVDVRWEPMPAGTVVHGRIRVDGLENDLTLASVVSNEEHEVWELNDVGVARLSARLNAMEPPPASVADLLAACDDEDYDV